MTTASMTTAMNAAMLHWQLTWPMLWNLQWQLQQLFKLQLQWKQEQQLQLKEPEFSTVEFQLVLHHIHNLFCYQRLKYHIFRKPQTIPIIINMTSSMKIVIRKVKMTRNIFQVLINIFSTKHQLIIYILETSHKIKIF